MSQGYQIYDQNKLHYLTFQIVQWVDVFTRNEYKQIIVNSFDYCRKNKGLELYAYVIMTNHIQMREIAFIKCGRMRIMLLNYLHQSLRNKNWITYITIRFVQASLKSPKIIYTAVQEIMRI
jgi:hypothetical protein